MGLHDLRLSWSKLYCIGDSLLRISAVLKNTEDFSTGGGAGGDDDKSEYSRCVSPLVSHYQSFLSNDHWEREAGRMMFPSPWFSF